MRNLSSKLGDNRSNLNPATILLKVLLQPRLNVRLSQKQVLTPGLVQMVSVLALNKLELRDMITAEMVENPVLEELEASVPLLDEVSQREEDRDRLSSPATAEEAPPKEEAKDPFDEVDFGAYFQEYLDPGYRSRQEWEQVEKPSFENFLSRATTLTDHLMWQLSAMHLRPEVEEAAELIIGNLNEEGYLTASDDELLGIAESPSSEPEAPAPSLATEASSAVAHGIAENGKAETASDSPEEQGIVAPTSAPVTAPFNGHAAGAASIAADGTLEVESITAEPPPQRTAKILRMPAVRPSFDRAALHEALEVVRQMD